MQQQFAIVLDAKELMELERILIDRDPEGAFRFLKECIKKKVDDARRSHIKPPI